MKLQLLISNGLILVGAGFMLASILLSLKMLPGLPESFRRQWTTLTGFMGFFLLGYLGFILVSLAHIPLPTELITGAVFLGGAFFVFMVIGLTKETISDLIKKDSQLTRMNQELEQRVEERTQSLQESMSELDSVHGELNQIMDTISTGVRLIDTNMTVLKVNKSFCTMTGKSEEELIGSLCYSNFKEQECKESDNCAFQRIKKNTKRCSCSDIIRTRNDGEQRHFDVTITPFMDAQGTLLGVVEDFQDITQRIQMEKEREQMQTQLLQRSKLESVGQLAAGIAHEINTPIQYVGTNIDFFAESFDDITALMAILEKELGQVSADGLQPQQVKTIQAAVEEADWEFLSDEVPTALKQTREGVNRVSTIVRAMKEFSHPGSREMAPANLNEILQNTLTVSSNEWKYVADIETDFADDLPMVPCLSEEMGQVFLNIIVNAAHAIKERQTESNTEEKGTITLSTTTEDEFALIRIGDTGRGMDTEVQERVFDPFFTTKEVGKGTGQGLSIAQDVVTHKHHGKILVESEPGVGTTFTIRLPLQEIKCVDESPEK